MRLSHTRAPITRVALVTVAATALAVTLGAQSRPLASSGPAIVSAGALEKLLPAPTGWTRIRTNKDLITLTETCSYSYADALYTNGAMKVRITLADTAADPSSLAVLATMVTSFPDDYSGRIPPATTIKRMPFNDAPAALRWDTAVSEGEFVVVFEKRFVAKAEGTSLDTADTLRSLVEQINLKALGELGK